MVIPGVSKYQASYTIQKSIQQLVVSLDATAKIDPSETLNVQISILGCGQSAFS